MAVKLPPIPQPKLVTSLGCPSCGGALEVQEGRTTISCRYCDTPLAVLGERGISRTMVLNTLDQTAASSRVRGWLSRGIAKDPALKKQAHFDEAFLAWFPFVRTCFDLVGWVLGIETKRRKRGDRWVTVEVPVERQVERSVDRTTPSASMAEFGVHRVDLEADEVLPLDEAALRARGMVFRPTGSPADAAQQLTAAAIAEAQAAHTLHRTTFSWFATLRHRTSLVYYPMWVFRYSFKGRTYQVLIDAEDGSVAYGKAPGNHLYRALTLVGACAGSAFIGTTVLQNMSWLARSDNGLAAIGVIGLVLAGLVHWGYSRFRHGGVVEEGTGLASHAKAKDVSSSVKQMMDSFQ